MKRILTIAIVAIMALGVNAQNQGSITPAMLQNFKESLKENPKFEALQNAVSNNSISKLALNRSNQSNLDTHFSDKVNTKGITDQESSGRCWLFTGLNVLRAKGIEKKNLKAFELSQNYSFFFDQLEKSNLFLEGIIENIDKPMSDKKVEWLFKHSLNDGGQWTGVVDIIEKYGVVPTDAMTETNSSNNTRWMSKLIKRKLKEDALALRKMNKKGKSIKKIRKEKEIMLSEVYKILAINLGNPPTEFTWRYEDADGNLSEEKTYTPHSFYKEFIGVDLNDYVMFMNDPSRPYEKVYEIDYDRHTYDGHNWKYINLENKVIKEFAIASIKGNDAMYFSCDVGKQLDRNRGVLSINNYNYGALLDVNFGMNKTERIQTFASGSSHGMTLVGVDLDKDGDVKKWLIENSWGASNGFKGHLIMTDKWYDEYMFRVVINKKYISEEVLKILDQKPVFLPPWDPMFAPEK
ncbi:MAG: C1 family peptidase [Bacteroidota bacterium]|nr:C1 family peptidase [Bacteroidota bacterium]